MNPDMESSPVCTVMKIIRFHTTIVIMLMNLAKYSSPAETMMKNNRCLVKRKLYRLLTLWNVALTTVTEINGFRIRMIVILMSFVIAFNPLETVLNIKRFHTNNPYDDEHHNEI